MVLEVQRLTLNTKPAFCRTVLNPATKRPAPRCCVLSMLGAGTHNKSLLELVELCVEHHPTCISASFCGSVAPYHTHKNTLEVQGAEEWAEGREGWAEVRGQSPGPGVSDGDSRVCPYGPPQENPGDPQRDVTPSGLGSQL